MKKKTTLKAGVQPLASWLEQLGAGGNTYRAGTVPYQEGGILPLLASLFSQQRGMGQQTGGFLGPIIEPTGELIKMGIQKKAVQRGRGASGSKKKKKTTRSKYNHRLVGIGSSNYLESIVPSSGSTCHWGVTRHDFRIPSRHGIMTSSPSSKSLFPRVTLRKSI